MAGINRLTSRILLFDRQGRILLFLTKAPDTSGIARWLTPGGGVDAGETQHQGAIRELEEETGLVLESLGEPVYVHDFVVQWDEADHDTGHAEFYTAVVDAFEPSDAHWTDDERVDVLAHRWWSVEELEATTEPFEPTELVKLVRKNRPRHTGVSTMAREFPTYTVANLEYLNAVEFDSMTNDDAVALGLIGVAVIKEWDLSLAVDIVLGTDLVFRAKLKSTGVGNDPWLTGKAAVATHFGEPSLLVKQRHLEAGTAFLDEDVDHETMKAHGGSIPLRVAGQIVGTITMSGEPDATDHEAAAETIDRYLGRGTGLHAA